MSEGIDSASEPYIRGDGLTLHPGDVVQVDWQQNGLDLWVVLALESGKPVKFSHAEIMKSEPEGQILFGGDACASF